MFSSGSSRQRDKNDLTAPGGNSNESTQSATSAFGNFFGFGKTSAQQASQQAHQGQQYQQGGLTGGVGHNNQNYNQNYNQSGGQWNAGVNSIAQAAGFNVGSMPKTSQPSAAGVPAASQQGGQRSSGSKHNALASEDSVTSEADQHQAKRARHSNDQDPTTSQRRRRSKNQGQGGGSSGSKGAGGYGSALPRLTEDEYDFIARDIMAKPPFAGYLKYHLPVRYAARCEEVRWEWYDANGRLCRQELIGGGKNSDLEYD